jgi:hypothetical protein
VVCHDRHRATGADHPEWKKDVFDRVWLITHQDSAAVLIELPQKMLPGDTSFCCSGFREKAAI